MNNPLTASARTTRQTVWKNRCGASWNGFATGPSLPIPSSGPSNVPVK